MINWQNVWLNKTFLDTESSLDSLINYNGFDNNKFKVSQKAYLSNALSIVKLLGIVDGDSIYEVGCGCGAFLKALSYYKNITVGGIDYSKGHLTVAKKIFPLGDFTLNNALNIDSKIKYDFVISHSMFQYLNLFEAQVILKIMYLKSIKSLAILDIPNFDMKSESEKERSDNYGSDYVVQTGLIHQYYKKDWFISQFNNEENHLQIVDYFLESPQKKFRFNFILNKNSL